MFSLKPGSVPKQTGTVRGRWQAALDDAVIGLAWSPDGTCIAALGATGPLNVFDSENGRTRLLLPGHRLGNLAQAWRPQGDLLATSGQDGVVRVFSPETGLVRYELIMNEKWVAGLTWSPAGNLLATGAGKTLRFWNVEGRLLVDCEPHLSTITDLQWRPESGLLASAAYGGVCFWTADRNRAKHAYEFPGSILSLAWSPDGKYLVTGNQDATTVFWEYESADEPAEMTGFPSKIRHLSWDRTGRYLITASGKIACVWDFSGRKGPRGKHPIMIKMHKRPISAVAFQHRGGLVATSGEDGDVAIWKLGRKEALMTSAFSFHQGVTRIAWSPDDQSIACGCDNGTTALLAVD